MANDFLVRMNTSSIEAGLIKLSPVLNQAVAFVMQSNVAPIENYMKQEAVWTDRTSNARNGLSARYDGEKGNVHRIVIFHMVDYGIWLEVAHEAHYAIINPTLKEQGPKVMAELRGLLSKMGGIL